MQSEIQYIKGDKVYKMKKQPWRPRKVRIWLLLPLLALMVMGGYVTFASIGTETEGQIEYETDGRVNYDVYLKENDYYTEKFLPSGMQYIANLINVVRAEFQYKFDASEDINANYTYEIIADAKATDRSNNGRILYENTEILKSSAVLPMLEGNAQINEAIDIDYQKYSDYMRDFRSDFGIAANCFLDLKMRIKIDGAIKTEDTLAMNIPLSDQTIDIMMDAGTVSRKEKVGEPKTEFYVKNLPILIVGSIIALISLTLVIVIIYYYTTRYNDNLYEKALHKILKEYDALIVEGSETIYEQENVVRVASFKELLDAQNLEQTPIVFFEITPGEKSYFIVNSTNGTTYRYTLTKAYQDKLAASGESEL